METDEEKDREKETERKTFFLCLKKENKYHLSQSMPHTSAAFWLNVILPSI